MNTTAIIRAGFFRERCVTQTDYLVEIEAVDFAYGKRLILENISLRIPRGKDFQSLNTAGLYPAGEGAGYAGGIMSAGVDGIEVAEALGRDLLSLASS